MEKLSDNLDNKEIEAVKKLLSKLSPEDLEKAVGGISTHAKNILIAAGALAIVVTAGVVVTSKLGGKSGVNSAGAVQTMNNSFSQSTSQAAGGPVISEKDLDEKIKKYNISEKLIEAVGGKEKVFDRWTYYDPPEEEGDKCVGELKLKKDFVVHDGRIYHKASQCTRNWLYTTVVVSGEKGRGVPVDGAWND